LLVAFHGWVGHIIVSVAETAGTSRPPSPAVPSLLLFSTILAILTLVLGKPEFAQLTGPEWLTEPLGRQLPFDVPSR